MKRMNEQVTESGGMKEKVAGWVAKRLVRSADENPGRCGIWPIYEPKYPVALLKKTQEKTV